MTFNEKIVPGFWKKEAYNIGGITQGIHAFPKQQVPKSPCWIIKTRPNRTKAAAQ